MTNKKRKTRYFTEFKESIVRLYQTGRSATSLAKKYQLGVSTVCKWSQQLKDTQGTNIISLKELELITENK